MEKFEVKEFGVNLILHASLYIKQCRILSGKYVVTFIRPWNNFDNGSTYKCGGLHALWKKKNSSLHVVKKNCLFETEWI